jgi:hypothetical protein
MKLGNPQFGGSGSATLTPLQCSNGGARRACGSQSLWDSAEGISKNIRLNTTTLILADHFEQKVAKTAKFFVILEAFCSESENTIVFMFKSRVPGATD